MEGVPRVDVPLHVHDLMRTPHITSFDGIDLIDQDIQMRKSVSDRRLSIDRTVSVQNLSIHLSTRHEAFATQHELITESLRPYAVLGITTDDIHRDVGIDKDHRPGEPS